MGEKPKEWPEGGRRGLSYRSGEANGQYLELLFLEFDVLKILRTSKCLWAPFISRFDPRDGGWFWLKIIRINQDRRD
jgi:hypothetical protein